MLKKPLGNSLPLMDKWLENSVKRRKALDNTLQSITSLPYDEATIILGLAASLLNEANLSGRSVGSYASIEMLCPHCKMIVHERIKDINDPPNKCACCGGSIDYLSFVK